MTNKILLRGCAPEPLIHYLKALGILRLVAEQLDKDVRGAWTADGFLLETTATEDELIDFFLNDYKPTPIVAPWNNGSGFHTAEDASDSGKKVVNLRNIENASNPRFELYKETIRQAKELVALCMPKISHLPNVKRSEALKPLLIPLCRNNFDDKAVSWIDTVCFLANEETLGLPPLLGSAGNDGNQEFSLTFMEYIFQVLPTDEKPRKNSSRQLRDSLLGETGSENVKTSSGQFNPFGTGGTNATSGNKAYKTSSLSRPWDFVLAIEGTILFAGAVVRRLGATTKSAVSYPFQVRSIEIEENVSLFEDNRGDLFVPVWERLSSAKEISHLFSEGRVRLGHKQPKDTLEFARAVASLGMDRGISYFQRFSFLTRNGNMQFATSQGKLEVKARQKVNLLEQFDSWLGRFRGYCSSKNTPKSFSPLLRDINYSSYQFCAETNEAQRSEHLSSLLLSLGKSEKAISKRPKIQYQDGKSLKDNGIFRPLNLEKDWFHEIQKVNYSDRNFQIARALASIIDEKGQHSIRENLESVEFKNGKFIWSNDSTSAIWSVGDLAENLSRVLQRRSIDARSGGLPHPQMQAKRFASLDSIAAFLDFQTDDEKLEDYLFALNLIDWRNVKPPEPSKKSNSANLPRIYALLKLLFLPDGKFIRRNGERIVIKHEPSIVPLLRAGRITDALEIAERRLRSSGIVPLTSKFYYPEEEGARLAAALLIPIDQTAIDEIARLVLLETQEI